MTRKLAAILLCSVLILAVDSVDKRYARDRITKIGDVKSWVGLAWRGEHLNAKLLLWSKQGVSKVRLLYSPLKNAGGESLGRASLKPRFVRYTKGCPHADPDRGNIYPDIIDPVATLNIMPNNPRPAWLNMNIPRKARSGRYKGKVRVNSENV